MNAKQGLLGLLLLLLCSLRGHAQQEPTFNTLFVPDQKVHDFGHILEKNGPVSHTFVLQNRGTKPLVINEVSAWCGCTTTQFQREPVAPGKTARVTVTFNPQYRPGTFSKEVVVLTDEGRNYVRLWVKGTVEGMEHPVTDDHPYAYGEGLYMSHRVLPFRALKKGERQAITLRVANDTDAPMTVTFLRRPDNRVLQMPRQITLKARERRVVEVSYRALREYAQRRYVDIVPIVNGKETQPLRITWLPAAR